MNDSQRKARFRGAILGTAIGDALGAPTENLSIQEIEAAIGLSSINGKDFIEHFRTRGSTIQKKGSWTDDTQLMLPLINSICSKNSIDPLDVAERICEMYESDEPLRGWSRSTKFAAKRLSEGVPWFRASDTSLGIGNGVAMRAAPLGLYLGQLMEEVKAGNKTKSEIKHCINSIISVGKITHNDPGITAGVLQATLIAGLINNVRSKSLILSGLKKTEYDFFRSSTFSDKLKKATRLSDISAIADTFGVDSRADHSWITAVAAFLNTKRKRDAISNMCELIRQGGDTDTTAAIYGSLAGAKWGVSAFPMNLRRDVEDSKKITSLADKLYENITEG